jgi:CPA1 family monovalent cation:H+ antiporter
MTFFHTLSILLAITAVAAYINHRYLRWPTTIGFVTIALLGSCIVIGLGALGVIDTAEANRLVESINFDRLVLEVMLAFLLFAGALNVDLTTLRTALWTVSFLATAGVVMATFAIGSLFWIISKWVGADLPFIYALLFGALISPTDPVAVLGILKITKVPRRMEAIVAGESLFNDGTAVVVFLAISGIATHQESATLPHVATFFLREVLGGAGLGLGLGWVTNRMMRSVDAYKVEVLLTLALAAGGYALAHAIGVSGPITVVLAGLMVGNQGRQYAMSETTRVYLDHFWELVDEILNAVLFILIGLEIITLTLAGSYVLAGAMAIMAVLLARFVSVALPVNFLSLVVRRNFAKGTIPLLTWAGLRGGISVALALSLAPSSERNIIVTATYIVVMFSILVQGWTLGWVIRKVSPTNS